MEKMKQINLPNDKYFQAEKDVRITCRANKEYKDKLKCLSKKYNLADGVLLSYMIDYFYEELIGKNK